MTTEQEREVVTIPGWIGFGLVVLAVLGLLWWFFWWVTVVPSDDARAMLCPRHEQRAATYRDLAEIRPLRDYELAGWATSDEYVKRWCE